MNLRSALIDRDDSLLIKKTLSVIWIRGTLWTSFWVKCRETAESKARVKTSLVKQTTIPQVLPHHDILVKNFRKISETTE